MERLLEVQSTIKPNLINIGQSTVDIVENSIITELDPSRYDFSEERQDIIYQYTILRYSIDEYYNLLSTKKLDKINQSKLMLSNYLNDHPLLYKGKYYSVTQDKQTQLLGTLNMYKQVQEMNALLPDDQKVHFDLTWNSTGNPCTIWTYEELSELLALIYNYVKRLVTEQQYIEVTINACNTSEEVDKVLVDYDNCPYSTNVALEINNSETEYEEIDYEENN